MDIIYESSFFLALALLAIEGTIFIFAISMLGRAMEAAVAKVKEKLAENSRTNTEELESIKKEISEAQASNLISSELTRKLNKLEKKGRHLRKELRGIRLAPKLLTMSGGLIPTAILLVVAIILSAVAWQLSSITTPASIPTPITTAIWAVGLIAMGFGAIRICKTMKVVEDVAITSEEAALRRTIDAFKGAQLELEDERRPVVQFSFRDTQPPFKMKAESELTIRLIINVQYGDKISSATVFLTAPEGFQFLNCEDAEPTLGEEAIRPVAAQIKFGDITGGTYRTGVFELKAPSEAGNYPLRCALYYQGGRESIEYEVEVVGET